MKINIVLSLLLMCSYLLLPSCKKDKPPLTDCVSSINGTWNIESNIEGNIELFNQPFSSNAGIDTTSCNTLIKHSDSSRYISGQMNFSQKDSFTYKTVFAYKNFLADSTFKTCALEYFIHSDSGGYAPGIFSISGNQITLTFPFAYSQHVGTMYETETYTVSCISSDEIKLSGTRCYLFGYSGYGNPVGEITLKRE